MDMTSDLKSRLYKGLKVALVVFLVILFARSLFGGFHRWDKDGDTEHTISFTGHGEVNAVPDIANVYFSITKDAKTVKEAQAMVAEVEKKALEFLRGNSVMDKDIKTSYASFNPKYEYQYEKSLAPCNQYSCPPNPGKSVIVGYTATESITVKVRNTDDVGKIMQGLGTFGVSDLSGPNFAIDNEDSLKAEARRKAITDAKSKAKVLARDLGVRLGDIVSFSDSSPYYPVLMYSKAGAEQSSDSTPPAELPKGENTISSDVTITYELR